MSYRFGTFEVDPQLFELRREGVRVDLPRQVFDVLLYLIRHRDRVVSRAELMDELWSDRVVTENAVSQCMTLARRALRDPGGAVIETVYGRGFRFLLEVEEGGDEGEVAPAVPTGRPAAGVDGPHVPGFGDRPAIAVLPFESAGDGEAGHEYFAEGIAEDLATRLARARFMPVISRASTRMLKGKPIDVRLVSHELGAPYLIGGSVRRARNRVRISAHLTYGPEARQVWAERYDRELVDLFALQDEISSSIMGQLGEVVHRHEFERTVRLDPSTLGAWELYARAVGHFMRMDREGCYTARALARQAVELAPRLADGWVLLSLTYSFDFWGEEGNGLSEALQLAERALRCDDTHPAAHTVLGGVCAALGDYPRALGYLERARELDPCSAVNYWLLGQTQTALGRADEAVESLHLAMRLSPNDPWMFDFLLALAAAHFAKGEYASAVEWARRSLQRRPDYPITHLWLGTSLAQLGRTDEAAGVLRRLGAANPGFSFETLDRIRPIRDQAFAPAFLDGLRKAGWADLG